MKYVMMMYIREAKPALKEAVYFLYKFSQSNCSEILEWKCSQ